MKEPTTVVEAQRLTLAKIKKCMERPRGKREKYWLRKRFSGYSNTAQSYCAFCIVAKFYAHLKHSACECAVKNICGWYCSHINNVFYLKWLYKDLRKLYRMVKEIEG